MVTCRFLVHKIVNEKGRVVRVPIPIPPDAEIVDRVCDGNPSPESAWNALQGMSGGRTLMVPLTIDQIKRHFGNVLNGFDI